MQAKYLAVYGLHRLTGIQEGNETEILRLSDPRTRIILTERPEEHWLHLDYTALATQLVNSRLGRTQQQEIEAAIASAEAARNKVIVGLFLVVMSVLIHSHQRAIVDLEAFLEAWAALEILVNGLFLDRYNEEWLSKLAIGTPGSAQRYFERLRAVMKDRYRLSDKFLIISSILDEMSAEARARSAPG